MNNFKPKCSYCKQVKPIAISVRGMHYCENHKGKAPGKKQFDEFLSEKVKSFRGAEYTYGNYKHRELEY